MSDFASERELLAPLFNWLDSTGRLRADSIAVEEFRWFGRRIDLATLTVSRSTTAFELKLDSTRSAIRQAAYNRLSFDRSYIVTAAQPGRRNLELAAQVGIGVIVVNGAGARVVLRSPVTPTNPGLRSKLLQTLGELRHVPV